MRKTFLLLVGVTLAAATVAAPAQAAPSKSTTTTAEAFWHFTKSVSDTQYLETTWYVGVFMTFGNGIRTTFYSDLYQDVELCKTSNDRCTEVSSAYGHSRLKRGTDVFTMDTKDLTTAHLHGTYMVQAFDRSGKPVGSPTKYEIVTDWTGKGSITKSHSKFTFHTGCIHFNATDKGKTRPATATGTLREYSSGKVTELSLGTTRDTMFGGDATVQVNHTC